MIKASKRQRLTRVGPDRAQRKRMFPVEANGPGGTEAKEVKVEGQQTPKTPAPPKTKPVKMNGSSHPVKPAVLAEEKTTSKPAESRLIPKGASTTPKPWKEALSGFYAGKN